MYKRFLFKFTFRLTH